MFDYGEMYRSAVLTDDAVVDGFGAASFEDLHAVPFDDDGDRYDGTPDDAFDPDPDADGFDDIGFDADGFDDIGFDADGYDGRLDSPVRAAAMPDTREMPGQETVSDLQARIRQMQGTRLDTRSLPTHPAIASLLPGGGLKQGAAYSVERSATLIMALLAGPSAAGSWCGVVGVPEFGVEAAARYGIDLDRLVLVPHPGDHWLSVTASIADVLTVVVTRPPREAKGSSVARLAARLRQRGSTLIVLGAWPQTEAMLSISHSHWAGIGEGHGHLAAREATVTVSTRAGGRPRSARMWLPDSSSQLHSVSPLGQTAEPRPLQPLTPVVEPVEEHVVEARVVEEHDRLAG